MDKELEKRLAALESELRTAKQGSAKHEQKKTRWLRVPHKFGRKQVLISAIALLFVIAAPTAYFYTAKNPSTTMSSRMNLKQIQADAGFDTYFPTALPKGFEFSPESVSLSAGVIIYTVTIPNGAEVVVTQQARAKNFDYQAINTQTSFKTLYGVGNVYEQGDKTMASLVSDTTWLLCNSSKSIGAKAMEDILQSMRRP